jgi:hypothetical protein
MTPPGPECTCGNIENHKVWLNGDRSRDLGARGSAGVRLPEGLVCNPLGYGYHW